MNKHIYLIIILFFIGIEASFSQKWEVNLSVNTGLSNVTKYPTSIMNNDEVAFSYSLGSNIERKLLRNSKLGFGFNFIQIGNREISIDESLFLANTTDSIGLADITKTITLKYLALPIYFKYKNRSFTVLGGIKMMYLIQTTHKHNWEGSLRGKPIDENFERIAPKFHKYDVGLFSEIGYNVNSSINMHLDLYFGLKDIIGSSNGRKNNIHQIGIGINYTIVKF